MRYYFIYFLLLTFPQLSAQFTGKIIDAITDAPVNKALIISGINSTFSENDGTFSVETPGFISIEADGYQRFYLKLDTLMPVVIRLHPLRYDLSEVVITTYHTPERLRSVAGAVSIIPVGPLQNAGYNIVQSLSGSPGVYIQEATPGTMKLTLRGIGSRYPYGTKKIKMFFDGIPLYSAEGETYFDEINPEYLSRIEIMRGPASSIYGASLGGAVVLYPRKPESGHSELKLLSSAGSYGYNKNTLTYSNGKGKDDLLVSLSRLSSDGYRENSNYLRNSFIIYYNRPLTDKVTGNLLLSGSLVNSHIPSSIDSSTFFSNPGKAAPQWLQTKGNKKPQRIMAGYKLKYQPVNNWDILSTIFITFRENEENRPFNFLNESGISYGGRILARYIKNTGQITYILTGGSNLFLELYNSSISANTGGMGVKGSLLQKGKQSIFQSDIFSQFELKTSELSLSGGFSFNKSGFHFTDQFSSDTIDQSGFYNFNPVFSPRVSLSWNPENDINTYLAINHGFTIPSLSETLTPLGLINRDIKPEKAWSYEAGVRFNLYRNTSFIDLALYYMRVSDLIVPKRIEEDFYIGINAGASLHRGIEIAVQQWLWGKKENEMNTTFSVVANLSYSLNKFNFLDFIEGENDFSGNHLPGMPEHFLAGSIDLKTDKGIYSQLEILSTGKIPLNDFNNMYTDPWIVLNAGAGYLFSLKNKWEIDAMLRFNNITNTRYASMVVVNAPGSEARPPRYYYPGMPRWFTFNIGLNYKLDMD